MLRVREFLRTKVWRLRWLLALNLYLISPLVIHELRMRATSDVPPMLLVFSILVSLLWLVLVQSAFKRMWLAHLVLFPFYLVVATDLFVIVHYGTRLSSSMISVVLENWSDAVEFIEAHRGPLIGWLAVLLAGYALCLNRLRGLTVSFPRYSALGASLGLAVSYGIVYFMAGTFAHVASHDRSTPFGVLPQTYLAFSVYRDVLRQGERTKSFKFHARRVEEPQTAEAYVLLIGESSRRDHWGVYGYHRQTTPRLARETNLVLFRDVISQASYTRASVPLILTRGKASDQERALREKSIVSVFNEVGFRTYWLSTQHRDPFTGAINRYSGEAKEQRFLERQHDDALLGMFGAALKRAGTRDKLFFVLHTAGSHFTYTNRYPRSFAVFPDKQGSERERLVNSYDNTIVYTDFILSELMRMLSSVQGPTALLYVSDHGENLKDDERGLFGHFLSNEYDLPVPMVFWYSGEFARRYPEKVASAKSTTNVPLSTRFVFYSVLDAAGITLDDPDARVLSVLSRSCKAVERFVLKDRKLVNYDGWLRGEPTARLAP